MPSGATQNPLSQLESLARARFGSLTAAEIKLLRVLPTGSLAICGPNGDRRDPANDPSNAKQWGSDRQIRASVLRWACVDRQAKELVDPSGIHVSAAKFSEEIDLSNATGLFPLRLWACRLMGDLKLIGTDLVALDLQGSRVQSIWADGALIKGDVLLRDGFHSQSEVRFISAQIGGDLDCSGAKIENPWRRGDPSSGKALSADGAVIKGGVYLTKGFRALGEVRLPGAEIGNQLDCSSAILENPPHKGVADSGVALLADRAKIKGAVFLSEGFRAKGKIWLPGAQIGSNFQCGGGTFDNSPQAGVTASDAALTLDGASIDGTVFFNEGFHAKGKVQLIGAQIAGDLDCHPLATFENPPRAGEPESGLALVADGAIVKGSAFLSDKFIANGEVRLLGAHIERDLVCSGAMLENPLQSDGAEGGYALSADGAVVTGTVFLNDGFIAKDDVRLPGIQIGAELGCLGATFVKKLIVEGAVVKGTLYWRNIVNANNMSLSLIGASVGSLADDVNSWPAPGNLELDGFTYRRISGNSPRDAKSRLDWLGRQATFSSQPYQQLANVLRDSGDGDSAKEVLVEMESRRRSTDHWSEKPGDWIFSWIGYGYHPMRAAYGLAGLFLLGWLINRRELLGRSMAPTDKDSYDSYKKQRVLPPNYPNYWPIIYSLENSTPFVKLGQTDRWQPDPQPDHDASLRKGWIGRVCLRVKSPSFWLRGFLWIQILLGWLLATLFVAGVTGLIR
jgi:hypothetical protein